MRIKNFRRVIVASSDTDILVNLIHHYWQLADLKELWLLSGNKKSQQAIPIHELALTFDGTVIDIFPAVHASTGTFILHLIFFKNQRLLIGT